MRDYWKDLEIDSLPDYERSPERAARKLRAVWTIEAEEDLRQWHGITTGKCLEIYQQMIQEGDL